MKLTPLDIRKQEFPTALRGYDPEEVRAFLQMLADQWTEQGEERRRLEERVREMRNKVAHYERVEEALQEALQSARDSKEQVVQGAKREAEVLVREARSEAEEIRRRAREWQRRLQDESSRIVDRRDQAVARLRALLVTELEILKRFEGADAIGVDAFAPSDPETLREAGVDVDELEQVEDEPQASVDPAPAPTPEADHASEEFASSTDGPATFYDQQWEETAAPRETPDEPEQEASSVPSSSEASSYEAPNMEEGGEGEPPDEAAPMLAAAEEPVAEDPPASEAAGDDSFWSISDAFDEPGAEELPDWEEPAEDEEEDMGATSEEIEKIRRILNDMD